MSTGQLPLLHAALLAEVRSNEDRDLSTRQLAVLLALRLDPGPHTVRGLAGTLQISRPAVCRVLDRLETNVLAQRSTDPDDRRSVLVAITPAGMARLDAMRTAASALPASAA